MSLLDLLVILVFCVVVYFAHFASGLFALGVLVLCLIVERVLKGERL